MPDQWEHHRRAQDCIAQSYLTNSKRPESLIKGIFPTHAKRGHGCHIWDHQGRKYLDFIGGLGTNLLGYANEPVNDAIRKQLSDGASLSLATHHELECAEKLKEMFVFADCWKFLKTGSEACSAAVRIARAKTGRMWVLSDGYHGWHDGFVSLTPPHLGCLGAPEMRFSTAKDKGIPPTEVAAIIIEPVLTEWGPERAHELQALREHCTKYGIMLIFDEIITGFRFPKFSAAGYFGITPDLICLGKAIANGLPLAAVGGKYATMNAAEYFVSSTYAGETLSLVAAKAVMTQLQTKLDLDWLWKQGKAFMETFNAIWPQGVRLEGYPTRGRLGGQDAAKALFMQEACTAGMLFGPSWWFNFPMVEEWRNAMGAIRAILEKIQRGEVVLKGEMPQSPFAQRVREAR